MSIHMGGSRDKLLLHRTIISRVWFPYHHRWCHTRHSIRFVDDIGQRGISFSKSMMSKIIKIFRSLDDQECLADLWHVWYILSLPLNQYLTLLLKVFDGCSPLYHGVGDGYPHFFVESNKIWVSFQYHLWLRTKLEIWHCKHCITHINLFIRSF